MSYQKEPSSRPAPLQQEVQPQLSKPRFVRVRGWLRSRTGRVLLPLLTLLVGIVLGVAGIFLFGGPGARPTNVIPANIKGDIIIEADRSFITQMVTKNLASSGLPGQIKNVNVTLTQGSQMIVNGEDVFSILGIQVTRPFTVTLQFYVVSCYLETHILRADVGNVPVTSFAHSFENQINQQLAIKPEGLPSGFQYCTTGVRTEPGGVFITYSAIAD